MIESCRVVLLFEPVFKIHSNETSFAVLSQSTVCFQIFPKYILEFVQFGSSWPLLGVKGLNLMLMLLLSQNFEHALVIQYCYDLM